MTFAGPSMIQNRQLGTLDRTRLGLWRFRFRLVARSRTFPCSKCLRYSNRFRALRRQELIAGLVGLGLNPRCVLQVPADAEPRRLQRIIAECPFSLHDLSRVQVSR